MELNLLNAVQRFIVKQMDKQVLKEEKKIRDDMKFFGVK